MALTASFTLVAHAGAQPIPDFGYWSAVPVPGTLPAVSAPSGKLRLDGGSSDRFRGGGGTFDVGGSYVAPLSFSTGYQLDASLESIGGDGWTNLGGHWFWRDPAVGLAGAYGEFNTLSGTEWWRLAFEGEAYFGRVSVTTFLGAEFGEVDTAFFTESLVHYYPTDDLALSGGYRHDSAGSYGLARLEYQVAPEYSGMTLFADGEWNDSGFDRVLGGVKFYFGPTKSLIRRHREDDPEDPGNPQAAEEKAKKDAQKQVVPQAQPAPPQAAPAAPEIAPTEN